MRKAFHLQPNNFLGWSRGLLHVYYVSKQCIYHLEMVQSELHHPMTRFTVLRQNSKDTPNFVSISLLLLVGGSFLFLLCLCLGGLNLISSLHPCFPPVGLSLAISMPLPCKNNNLLYECVSYWKLNVNPWCCEGFQALVGKGSG